MGTLRKLLAFPKIPFTSLIGACVYAFSGFIRLPSYASTVWYLSRLLAVYAILLLVLFTLSFPARRHPLAIRNRLAQMHATCADQLLDYSKLAIVALFVQRVLSETELARLFSLLVVYIVLSPIPSYLLALVFSLASRGQGFVARFADVTPLDDVALIAAIMNPAGRTFTGVPPDEQLYREFRPPRSEDKTSAVKRTTSATEGSEGAGRCKVLDEGPHFNRTARGCLLSV